MKKLLFINMAAFFIFLFSVTTIEAQMAKNSDGKNAALSTLNGSWQVVSTNENGKIKSTGKPLAIYGLNDGFYTWFGPDSTGNWNKGGSGTYEKSGNMLKQKIKYSSWPERIGTINWNEVEMRGDTLFVRFRKRIDPKGEDITARFPIYEAKWIRSKQ